jgi:enterochelin esterase-like enzyme
MADSGLLATLALIDRARSAGRLCAIFLVGALLLLAAVTASARTAGSDRTSDIVVPAPSLGGELRAAVVLPPGYATSGKRYPVVYFLHGLPAAPFSYRGVGFLRTALRSIAGDAILVAPQGARDGDGDGEYLDWGPGRNWETAIARDLPHYVDARYRTIESRRGRALVGLSAGGYGAVLLALHNLGDFGVVESWSGYFHPTDPSGTHSLDLGSTSANARASAHALIGSLRADERRRPTYLAFYVGGGDARFRAENERFDAELRAAQIPHLFRVYAGGHESAVWAAHAADWLRLALQHLRPAA